MPTCGPAHTFIGVASTVALAAGALAIGAGPARAQMGDGCDAANRGRLDISVAAGESRIRDAVLAQGDALALTVSTGAEAVLSVERGDGVVETLHAGSASSVLYVVPRTGDYGFRFAAGGGAGASLGVKCSSVARADAERALRSRRKAFLAQRDPNHIRIDRPRGSEFKPFGDTGFTGSPEDGPPRDITASFTLSELTAAMNPDKRKDPGILDFWFEGRHLSYDTARPNDGNLMVMYFGSKVMLGPDIMVGALAQFDQAEEGSGVSARGWMAGPYMSVRFGHGIFFDGRAAWGTADGGLPRGIALDTTSAERRLVRGTLRGTRPVAGWTFSPSVGVSYVEDTPTLQGTAISPAAPAAAGSGRLDFLPELKRRFALDSETYVEPRFAAGGFLAFEDISEIAPAGISAHPDLHWKAEAGVALGKKDSLSLEAKGGVETGGQTGTDNWSGRLQLNMPLGK